MSRFGNLSTIAIVTAAIIAAVVIVNVLFIKFNGKPVPVPTIPRKAEALGDGTPLTYIVLGDSTAVGQGGDYASGIARSSAELLATRNKVTFYNFAVSGARLADVKREQLPQAAALKPDVVLVAAGANDVTHLTPIGNIMNDAGLVIDQLRAANPDVRLVFTGSPAMGSVPRFAQPLRFFAKLRTDTVNSAFERLRDEKSFTLVPLAARTGDIFARRPELFAPDKFHPSTGGYNVWVPVINEFISKA